MFTRSKSAAEKISMENNDDNVVINILNELKLDMQTVKASVAAIPAINANIGRIEKRLDEMELVKRDVEILKDDNKMLTDRVKCLESSVNSISTVEDQYKKAVKKLQVQKSIQELLSKRWNIVAHGVLQDKNNDGSVKWESRHDSCDKVREFLREALLMDNDVVNNLVISDAHRLHVKIPKRGRDLPLIFKLGSLIDKKLIYDKLSNLRAYNEKRVAEGQGKVFVVMEHLPDEMQEDRKSLLPVFKKAKTEEPNSKRVWFADRETGRYCLRVGNIIHTPK